MKGSKTRSLGIDKIAVYDSIRRGVISVLSENEAFASYVGNRLVLETITNSVFKSLFHKVGTEYFPRKNGLFPSMLDSILFNAKKAVDVSELKAAIETTAKKVNETNGDCVTRFSVLQANVHDVLDKESQKDLEFFENELAEFVNSHIYAGSGFDISKHANRTDVLYLDLILVAEGTNSNKDTIPAEELEASYLTLIGMPLVEEHVPDAIKGVFYDSKLVRIKPGKAPGTIKLVENGGRLAVRAKAYIYKNRFPREAAMIKNRQEQGLLRYSVELGFRNAECSECHKLFGPSDQYCEHLLLRHVADVNFTRIVRGTFFIGGAYTINPAEKEAVGLSVEDPTHKKDEKVNKNQNSCVSNIEGDKNILETSTDVDNQVVDGGTAVPPTETLDASNNGGDNMKLTYESVEQLLAATEVNTLIEAKVADIVAEEREAFTAAAEEFEQKLAEKDKKVSELTAQAEELQKKLQAAESELAATKEEKRVSDVISNLINDGFKFENEEALKAFASRIRDKSDEDIAYIVDLMKKTITAATEPAKEDPVVDDVVNASRKTDIPAKSQEGNDESVIATARKSWTEKLSKVLGG